MRDVVYSLKHLPLSWSGQNMKAISYMLNPLGWCGRNMKTISYMLNPLGWCGRNMKAISYLLQKSCTLFKT